MKKINYLIIIILLLSFNTFLYSQPLEESSIKLGDWEWLKIDDFETCYRWPIINKLNILKKWILKNPTLSIQNGASKNLSATDKKKCLAVKIKMDHAGDTRKFIVPLYNLDIKGICEKITFWVHSRNVPLTIRVRFKDYMNSLHTLEPTEFILDFYGWKKLEVNKLYEKIDDQLPTTAPDYKPLQIVSFVIENPRLKVFYNPVYIYIDQLEAYTRIDELTEYDGYDMPSRW